MRGKFMGTLACAVLLIAAPLASAETSLFGVEYRWIASLGSMETSAMPSSAQRFYRSATFMRLMAKPIMSIDTDRDRRAEESRYAGFRQPDPELALPQAFRRPSQVRLVFSVRF